VTFEVETINYGKIFLSTSRIYGAKPDVISRLRNHFMIMFKANYLKFKEKTCTARLVITMVALWRYLWRLKQPSKVWV